MPSYKAIEKGALYSNDYRIFIKDDFEDTILSPMHDIPLHADKSRKIFHMVVEIPRWTNAKMEINKEESLNPIKQDTRNGKLRFVPNCFPHHGYIWNYGALPQTWESPHVLDSETGFKGDNDPIDVLEIGQRVAKSGDVLKVKILGAIALIDQEETDWKLLSINVNDPLANQMNDLADIDKHFPGLLRATFDLLKIYKIPDGKSPNSFAFNNQAKPRDFALRIIEEVHNHWKKLMNQEADAGSISRTNTTVKHTSFQITEDAAMEVINKAPKYKDPKPIDPIIDKWHFIKAQELNKN